MPEPCRGVIFSDLDGTFLDDRYYPVIDATQLARVSARWRVVWVSSRTIDEVRHLQTALDHTEDAIGENGGVCVTRTEAAARALGDTEQLGNAWVAQLASGLDVTTMLVKAAFTEAGLPFRSLEDFAPEELARRAHYGIDDALRAQRRRASVLVSDVDMRDARSGDAIASLRSEGCSVAHGGHWVSVVHGADKGTAALAWLAHTASVETNGTRVVAAIGNSENDEPLLAAADFRFVVRNPATGHSPALTAIDGARRLRRPGTAGWIEMVETLDRITGQSA